AFTTDAAQLYDLTIFAGATNVFDHGRVDTDENTRTVSFSSMPDARVVMGPASREGNDPGEIRLGNVGDSSFQHVFQEWDYLDGGHNKEKASWLALPDGASSLGSLDAEAGAVSVKHAWKTVSFERTFSSIPVVIPTVTTKNGWAAVVTRLRNVSTTGFQIRLQEEEAADDIHHFETVHWVAIEPGATGANGHKIEVGHTGDVVTESNVFIWVPSNMSDSPKFLAAAQTYGGPDPASLRFSKANMGILGEAIAVHMDEEQSQDNETDHSAENVGYIFID
ncbi:MAG: H-type lectin domain-containing protein, partial [Acidobacteriota bacterium]